MFSICFRGRFIDKKGRLFYLLEVGERVTREGIDIVVYFSGAIFHSEVVLS